MIVLDASVILKWIFQEPDSPVALHYRDEHISGKNVIVAPELLYYEVANVLAIKSSVPVTYSVAAFQDLLDMQIETYSLGTEEYLTALGLAVKYRVTVYDASYAILADRLNCRFVTADKRLFRKLSKFRSLRLLR